MSKRLYPFQKVGAEFLYYNKRAYLADQMGLGKTVQAITAARAVGPERTLVVCPASAVPNWEHEWAEWDGPGTPEVISYSSLIRHGIDRMPELVILDEAHYTKSPSAKRSRAALRIARKAEWAWLLSGTPMPNNPTELWTPIKYLWPEIAKAVGCSTKFEWMNKFTMWRPTPYGPKPYAVDNGALLRKHLNRIMLRRRLEDVGLELPPLRVDLVRLPKNRSVEKVLDAAREELQGDVPDEFFSETDYTSTFRRILGTAKAPLIARQIIEELQDGAYNKIVVLYYHKDVRDALRSAFNDAGILTTGFGGETSQGARQQAIERFQENPAFQVFLAQQTAAGVAITLTAASEIVLAEPDWTPAVNEQAVKRIHRIGQSAPCRARVFSISGTLDDSIMRTIRQKTQMQIDAGLRKGGD